MAVAPLTAPRRYDAYRAWLEADHHGSMSYMAEPAHVDGRRDLRSLLDGARSVIVVATAYEKPGDGDEADGAIRGSVAGYARGDDYHTVLKRDLYALSQSLCDALGAAVAARACVDTAPVLERELAEAVGLGFVAKNTMLITPGLGSYTVLGELLVDVDIAATEVADRDARARCGTCTACLDACPTSAFPAPYVLDARRCISYLTIEHRGAIPRELRPAIGTMVFGCDICQQVCPFNAAAPDRTPAHPQLAPRDREHAAPDLIALLRKGSNQRKRYLASSAMRRVNREQLLRNTCVALGNSGDQRAVAALTELLDDRSAVVREHAAWALEALGVTERSA